MDCARIFSDAENIRPLISIILATLQ